MFITSRPDTHSVTRGQIRLTEETSKRNDTLFAFHGAPGTTLVQRQATYDRVGNHKFAIFDPASYLVHKRETGASGTRSHGHKARQELHSKHLVATDERCTSAELLVVTTMEPGQDLDEFFL